MNRSDTLTLGEFRELTKDMDDQVAIVLAAGVRFMEGQVK